MPVNIGRVPFRRSKWVSCAIMPSSASSQCTIMTTHLMIIFLIGVCFCLCCCVCVLVLLFMFFIVIACEKVFFSQPGRLLYMFVCLLHTPLSRMPIHWNRSGFRVVKHALHQLSSYENSLYCTTRHGFFLSWGREEWTFHFYVDHRLIERYWSVGPPKWN